MILRIWRTKIDPARLEAYRRFERERCLPILHKQPGLLGVLFLREAEDQAASITIWEDRGTVEALESSPSYRRTVRKLAESGLLVREQEAVEIFEVAGRCSAFGGVGGGAGLRRRLILEHDRLMAKVRWTAMRSEQQRASASSSTRLTAPPVGERA